jgi:threonine dehydrogenase-like Zn-dependent dehydrogenase
MKAVVWHARNDVRTETVPDPKILNSRDCIVAVTSTAICGSDLHLYDGYIPTMHAGDILGHEFMGEVVEIGPDVKSLRKGDRVVVPFCIACGSCFFCKREKFSLCDNSNPNAALAEKAYGYTTAGLFGYSHLTGGYAGGQAEFVRVPFADVGPLVVPKDVRDEAVLFLGDILSTAWQAVEQCDLEPGQTVAVFGCGPIGLLSIVCALELGAERVIAIDHVPERKALALKAGAAACFDDVDDAIVERLREATGGRGPDAVIDAVGMEAHGAGSIDAVYDRVKQAARLETDRPHALRTAIQSCRKGGVLSIPGVYGGVVDKLNLGASFQKGLTWKMGQTHVHKWHRGLLERIIDGALDPSFIITHRASLDDAPAMYRRFRDKEDGCVKVVMRP